MFPVILRCIPKYVLEYIRVYSELIIAQPARIAIIFLSFIVYMTGWIFPVLSFVLEEYGRKKANYFPRIISVCFFAQYA